MPLPTAASRRCAAFAEISEAWQCSSRSGALDRTFFTAAEVNQGRCGSLPYMIVIHNFGATADLQELVAYLGIMATILVAVACASHRDRQKERQKKHAPRRPSQKTGKLAERLLTLNSEGPRSRAYSAGTARDAASNGATRITRLMAMACIISTSATR
jgi:hypothetical protein